MQPSAQTRILDIAEAAVLAKGFGATSIEEIAAEAGISKNGFFYHFKDKNALALALLQRSIEHDEVVLNEIFSESLSGDVEPLNAFLNGLERFARMMEDLPNGHPGCLVATYCYQERLFERDVRRLNREIIYQWRRRFRRILDDILGRHVPRQAVDPDAIADMVISAVEGGMVLSRATGDPKLLPQQIRLVRSYVTLLFA